jgi:hypothetical protein
MPARQTLSSVLTAAPQHAGQGLDLLELAKIRFRKRSPDERERNGCPFDNRHMLMLASVKADLYEFEIGDRKGGKE